MSVDRAEVEAAIGRAFGVYSTGGLSNAMYEATDPDDVEGYAVDAADWQTITAAARAWLESPTTEEVEAAAEAVAQLLEREGQGATITTHRLAEAALAAARRSREAAG